MQGCARSNCLQSGHKIVLPLVAEVDLLDLSAGTAGFSRLDALRKLEFPADVLTMGSFPKVTTVQVTHLAVAGCVGVGRACLGGGGGDEVGQVSGELDISGDVQWGQQLVVHGRVLGVVPVRLQLLLPLQLGYGLLSDDPERGCCDFTIIFNAGPTLLQTLYSLQHPGDQGLQLLEAQQQLILAQNVVALPRQQQIPNSINLILQLLGQALSGSPGVRLQLRQGQIGARADTSDRVVGFDVLAQSEGLGLLGSLHRHQQKYYALSTCSGRVIKIQGRAKRYHFRALALLPIFCIHFCSPLLPFRCLR